MEITFNGIKENQNWKYFSWTVNIKGEVFQYNTGLGHSGSTNKKTILCVDNNKTYHVHVPLKRQILFALALDADAGSKSFDVFCNEYGYERKEAFRIYDACVETRIKMEKLMKSENWLNRILEWNI